MRTHKDKLQALLSYLELNTLIATYRLRAEHFYDMNDEKTSWEYLFRRVKVKDDRAQMWKWFKHEYSDAMLLKEGYYETYK
jgi:hypothetical protein